MGNMILSQAVTTATPNAGAGTERVDREPNEVVRQATMRAGCLLLLHFGAQGQESISTFEIKPESVRGVEEVLSDIKGKTFQEVMNLEIPRH